MKYSINIELNENGSTTYLGEFKISAKLADKLKEMECDKPRDLKSILNRMVSKLEWLKTYIC